MAYFYLECQNPIKKSNNVLFFAPTCPILLSKPLECKILIKNLIWLSLLMHPFYEKIQDSSINSKKFGDLPY
jgi:hypothetical protein